MLSTALGLTFLAAFIWRFIVAARKSTAVELFPSFAWGCLMVLPFVAETPVFHPDYLASQTVGIFLVAFTLLFADSLSAQKEQNQSVTERLEKSHAIKLAFAFALTSLLVQIIHVMLMPKIPLLEAMTTNATETDLKYLREDANKLLKAPFGFLYLCHLTIMFFTPVAAVLFAFHRRWALATLVLLLTLIYSRLTLTKAPVLTLSVLICLASWVLLPQRLKKKASIAISALAALVLIPSAIFLSTSSMSVLRYKPNIPAVELKADTLVPTLGENWSPLNSEAGFKELPGWQKKLNYFVYRSFLDPIEVAHRWYQYYPTLKGKFIGLDGLTPSSRLNPGYVNPSNEIGIWVFHRRFPERYLKSVTAPPSIDADAWARFGYTGLAIVALLLAAVRYSLTYLRLPGLSGRAINVCAIGVLALTTPVCPLPTILVVQGVGSYLALYLAYRLYSAKLAKGSNVG